MLTLKSLVQGVTPRKPATEAHDGNKPAGPTGSKRITTPHACAECKRRKIRCDGQQPCGQCLSSRAPKRCFYDKHRQRVIPSRKYVISFVSIMNQIADDLINLGLWKPCHNPWKNAVQFSSVFILTTRCPLYCRSHVQNFWVCSIILETQSSLCPPRHTIPRLPRQSLDRP
jgi:hypothetical protein